HGGLQHHERGASGMRPLEPETAALSRLRARARGLARRRRDAAAPRRSRAPVRRTPLVLRSAWSFGAALAAAAWIVLRTALEDATLRRELPGYDAFTRRTRARLLPGLW
ncbi:MAG TPA: hypothetical protein PLU22_18990, partial [Polyangiaceae bacterium]|nr:hypothetical protein [Polyangiaceae bacterium]